MSKRRSAARWPLGIVLALACCALSACASDEGDETARRFGLCGNGAIDGDEACDDGNTSDTDACLSSCQLNACGDEFLLVGTEQCDGRNLNPLTGNFNAPFTCHDLGLGDGTLRCDPGCRFDTSACGPPFTPTPTVTSTTTPTATPTIDVTVPTPTPSVTMSPTPSPSPSPTPNVACGNGDLDEGETCDDGNTDDDDPCPSDCVILPCEPLSTTVTVDVTFTPPQFESALAASVLISYPDGTVSLPGTGQDPSVQMRVTMRQQGAIVTPNDLEHALRVVASRAAGITEGRLFRITFDRCAGAGVPSLDMFSCRLLGCSNEFGPTEGCECAVTEAQ